jgi:hypothetical protein
MFDPRDDFTAVADGLESVTLLRRGSDPAAGTVIAHALRRAMTATEAPIFAGNDVHKTVPGGGRHTAANVVWHLPTAELADAPRLGDLLVDAAGRRWTILEVKRSTLGTRWCCSSREVAIAFGLDDTISVLKAVGPPAGSDPAEPVWRTWRTGIRARIQPIDMQIVRDPAASSTTARYRIFVEENLELDHTCSIRGPDGVLYTITSAIGAERIGEMQVINVERTWSSGGQVQEA